MEIPETLVLEYIDNLKASLKKMQSALEEGDYSLVARIGHALHGSGATYGLDEVSDLGKEIEKQALAEHEEEIHSLLDRLENTLLRLQPEPE